MLDKITAYLRNLRQTDPRSFAEAILKMDDGSASEIIYHWPIFARKNQLPPKGDWRIWLVLAGRGLVLNQAHVKSL